MKSIWLIVINNHNSEPEYIVCSTEEVAEQKFVKIILNRYINFKNENFENIKKEIFKAVDSIKDNFYKSKNGDTLVILKEPLVEQCS